MGEVDLKILMQATGATEQNAKRFLPYLQAALRRFELNNNKRIIAFLAQVGHESGGLRYTTELADGSAYEGRKDLGNYKAGDGKRFKGRGPIQITGRSNYREVGKALGQDFERFPELLAPKNNEIGSALQLKNGIESAAWFWKTRGLNEIADKLDFNKASSHKDNVEIFKQITKKINGGYNGLSDRENRLSAGWKLAQSVNENKGTIGMVVFFLTALLVIWKRKKIQSMLSKYLPK